MGNSGIKGASMAFKIIRNDITKVKADAIVNSANPDPVCMPGSDSAVYLAAGAEKLLEERKKAGHIKPGQVAVTPAFGLDAGYIFHTVGPVWNGGDEGERKTVRECYTNCLNKAKEMGIESIAFPLISTGVYGFPKAEALLIATSVFSSFLSENDMDITLVVFDNESFSLSDKIFAGVDQFIDENYVELKTDEEYCGTAAGFAAVQSCHLPQAPCPALPSPCPHRGGHCGLWLSHTPDLATLNPSFEDSSRNLQGDFSTPCGSWRWASAGGHWDEWRGGWLWPCPLALLA